MKSDIYKYLLDKPAKETRAFEKAFASGLVSDLGKHFEKKEKEKAELVKLKAELAKEERTLEYDIIKQQYKPEYYQTKKDIEYEGMPSRLQVLAKKFNSLLEKRPSETRDLPAKQYVYDPDTKKLISTKDIMSLGGKDVHTILGTRTPSAKSQDKTKENIKKAEGFLKLGHEITGTKEKPRMRYFTKETGAARAGTLFGVNESDIKYLLDVLPTNKEYEKMIIERMKTVKVKGWWDTAEEKRKASIAEIITEVQTRLGKVLKHEQTKTKFPSF